MMTRQWRLAALCLSIFCAIARSQGVDYRVDLRDSRSQTIRVTMVMDGLDPDQSVTVRMPNWRPGRYVILDNAGAIRWIHAHSAEGDPLPLRKTRKDAWALQPGPDGTALIEYEMFANELSLRTRHADDTHAFISGSAVFLYNPDRRGREHRVRLATPDGWKISTGMPERDGWFIAENYDILVDSPIEAGELQIIHFEVDGVPHEIAIWGPAEPDGERLSRDFTKIIRDHARIFGDMPYERYVFLVHCGPGFGGGTEHWNSTIMGARPEVFTDDTVYRNWLGLVSHEMFHTWNVKRLRPAAMVPYDYQNENLTSLLWVAEGTTSYYDDLTLVRTGLITVEDYLGRLSRSIDGYRRSPGRKLQSLSESSFDAWIKFNKRTSDSPNSTISFYRKGSLVNLLLDIEIRTASTMRRSLDDVMRDMYERFPLSGGGYVASDFREASERASGTDLGWFWENYVDGVTSVPFEHFLERVGLELVRDRKPGDRPSDAYMGVRVTDSGGLAEVTGINSDGPAYDAGVIAGDLILAINGERVRPADFDRHVSRMTPGATVELTLFRRDRIRTYTFDLGEIEAGKWTIRKTQAPTEQQREMYEAWIHLPWDEAETGPKTSP